MKKLSLVLILMIGFAGILFAWEPNDLTKFPSCMNEKSIILNLGIGHDLKAHTGGDYIYIPPVRLSFDFNKALGDKKLPFFFGGIVGYSGYGIKNSWYHGHVRLGVRAGYHFNWGIDKLDTYAVGTAGWTIYHGHDYVKPAALDPLFYDVNIGARWFINDWFGFWAEGGLSSVSFFNAGLSFKF